jgi:hypothetical protein
MHLELGAPRIFRSHRFAAGVYLKPVSEVLLCAMQDEATSHLSINGLRLKKTSVSFFGICSLLGVHIYIKITNMTSGIFPPLNGCCIEIGQFNFGCKRHHFIRFDFPTCSRAYTFIY